MNENPLPSPEYGSEQSPRRSGRSARTASVLCVLALLAAGLGVRSLFHRPLMGGDVSREVTEPFDSVRVEGVSCDVRFFIGGSDVCTVDYKGPSRMSCTVEVKNGCLVIQEKSARWGLSFFSLRNLRDDKLEVFLPVRQYSGLSVETASGDVEVPAEADFRTVSLSTVSGEIAFSGKTDGELTAESVSGDVDIRRAAVRSLQISTTSGEQRVTDTAVTQQAELSAISGDITILSSDAESISISTVSGDVHTALLSPKLYQTDTTSGNVSVTAARTGAERCEISTVSGDILCE